MGLYNIGTKVKLQTTGVTGVITRIKFNPPSYDPIYKIKFDDTTLIPPYMDFEEKHLIPLQYCGIIEEDETLPNVPLVSCPICKSPWHTTEGLVGGTQWKDCLKCNKTYEELIAPTSGDDLLGETD